MKINKVMRELSEDPIGKSVIFPKIFQYENLSEMPVRLVGLIM